MVPRDGFRPLDAGELSALLATGPASVRTDLIVFDIGSGVLEESHARLLPLASETEADSVSVRDAVQGFRTLLINRVAEVCGLRAPAAGRGDVVVHGPGQLSTAFNYDAGVFMGLHIDNHQRLPLDERDRANTLCAANVGFGERYLHFVNLPASGLLAMLAERGISAPNTAEALKDAFLARFPDYPVIRLTLLPGHAYLCNTQNTIHDGATPEGDLPDVSFLTMNRLEPVGESSEALAPQ